MKKRLLSALLVLAMVIVMVPAVASAATLHKITYNTNGGGTIASANLYSLPNPLPTPTSKPSSTVYFDGWYYDSSLTQIAAPGDALSTDVTLYARWSDHQHTWTYRSSVVDSSVLYAECSILCTNAHTELRIYAPSYTLYDGKAKPATLSAKKLGAYYVSDSDILYQKKISSLVYGAATSTVPSAEGTYRASITVAGYTAYVEYTISGYYTDYYSLYSITNGTTDTNGTVTPSSRSAFTGDTVNLYVSPARGYILNTLTVTTVAGKSVSVRRGNNSNYSFTMPAAAVVINATFVKGTAAQSGAFVDVDVNSYSYDAIVWAADKGITSGKDVTHFGPDQITTRAEMITFLWRAAGSPASSLRYCPFTDVERGSYCEQAILWALDHGYVNGTSETTFSPDAPITRGQAVTFIARLEHIPDYARFYSCKFKDVKQTDYYNNAIAWAAEKKIASGTGADTFSPNEACTRAQVVTFLYRYYVV